MLFFMKKWVDKRDCFDSPAAGDCRMNVDKGS